MAGVQLVDCPVHYMHLISPCCASLLSRAVPCCPFAVPKPAYFRPRHPSCLQVSDQAGRPTFTGPGPSDVNPASLITPLPPNSDEGSAQAAAAGGARILAVRRLEGGTARGAVVKLKPRGDFTVAFKSRDGGSREGSAGQAAQEGLRQRGAGFRAAVSQTCSKQGRWTPCRLLFCIPFPPAARAHL